MRDLTKYRLDMAEERLDAAALMIDVSRYKISISNSYYAIFNAARALLAERNVDFKKHSAVISCFRREYVKTGAFDVKFSDYIGKAFTTRHINMPSNSARRSKNIWRRRDVCKDTRGVEPSARDD